MDTFQREKVDKLLGKWYQFELKKSDPKSKVFDVPRGSKFRRREREREKKNKFFQDTLLDGLSEEERPTKTDKRQTLHPPSLKKFWRHYTLQL